MIEVQVDAEFAGKVSPSLIEQSAMAALQHQGMGTDPEITILISSDAHIQALNQQYLEIDAPTDVLSFPADEEGQEPGSGSRYLGDIIISYPYAERQAVAGGHLPAAELQLLTVHGVLHLLGHDHSEPVEKGAMWSAQAEILRMLGCEITGPVLE